MLSTAATAAYPIPQASQIIFFFKYLIQLDNNLKFLEYLIQILGPAFTNNFKLNTAPGPPGLTRPRREHRDRDESLTSSWGAGAGGRL